MILEYVAPNWATVLGNRYRIFFSLLSVAGTSCVALIRPLWFIRLIFGASIASLGIMWHATLSSYEYLYRGANYILDYLDYLGFTLPLPSKEAIFDNDKSAIYTIVGVLLLGTIGIACSIILLEWFIPPVKVPIEETYWERFYSWGRFVHKNETCREIIDYRI